MLGNPHLAGRALREDITHAGQADWARPDAATVCAECAYWQAEPWERRARAKARCGLAARMMKSQTKLVPRLARSCRFFEPAWGAAGLLG